MMDSRMFHPFSVLHMSHTNLDVERHLLEPDNSVFTPRSGNTVVAISGQKLIAFGGSDNKGQVWNDVFVIYKNYGRFYATF